MTRDLSTLENKEFDLLIVGAGIYGAWTALDAALRGLSVALVDQGDFGHATSANSLKVIHGGFRYLQNGDLKRLRESSRERNTLLRVAPHLTQVMPFLLPTYSKGIQRRGILRIALTVYDWLTQDRNRGIRSVRRQAPCGRTVSKDECLRLAPGLSKEGLTGGAIWHDGQIHSPERLALAIVRSAVEQGAAVANYVKVTRLQRRQDGALLALAEDIPGKRTLEMRARLVINAAGPWINQLLPGKAAAESPVFFSKAIDVITRPLTNQHAVSVFLPSQNRRLYIAPWKGRAMAGSLYVIPESGDGSSKVRPEEIKRLVADLNAAYPGAVLRTEEVSYTHVGRVPRAHASIEADPNRLRRHYQILDHERDGFPGLVSVVGVKYTTARDVAQKTVNLAVKRLGRPRTPSRTAETPVWGGDMDDPAVVVEEALQKNPTLKASIAEELVHSYGTQYTEVIADAESEGLRRLGGSSVVAAQIAYAVRSEMAVTLSDVVFRRTDLGTAGHPGADALREAARVMSELLAWNDVRMQRELAEVEEVFADHGVGNMLPEASVRS